MNLDSAPAEIESSEGIERERATTGQGRQPLRVLQVMGSMNRGGAENFVMNLYREINRDQVQFDFVVHIDDEAHFDPEIEQLGGRIFHAPRYRGWNHFAYSRWWKRFYTIHPEYRIVHGHMRSTAAIYLIIAKHYGVLTIAHSHSTTSGSGPTSWAKNVMQLPIRHFADHLFACSSDSATWLFGRQAATRTHIVNNAIRARDFAFDSRIRSDTRRELGLANEFVIGHVGRFHPVKNHAFLIALISELMRRSENVVLLLVGDGELRTSVEQKVSGLGLEHNVRFLGNRTDPARLMQAMDFLVLPSLHEGFPVVLVEAQATGLLCVVSDTITREAAITELVDFLPLKSGVDAWADRLTECRPSKMREEGATAIVAAGFDSSQVAKWIADFYLQLDPYNGMPRVCNPLIPHPSSRTPPDQCASEFVSLPKDSVKQTQRTAEGG